MKFHLLILILFVNAQLYSVSHAAELLFDTHLHYSAADAALYKPENIIERLERNGVRFAVVTGMPASHTATLYKHAPEHIVPLLGVYRSHEDKISWPHDVGLPARVKLALDTGNWYGIGELHIFAQDRHTPVFRQVIGIARKRHLPLLLHADPAVIDALYEIAPMQTVIWAHAGTFPCPDLIDDYLRRYPSLYVDLSVRDELVAPKGQIDEAWYELLVKYPKRFMTGVDTYSVERWRNFDATVTKIRSWLAQLPADVARQISYDNAAVLFGKSINNERKHNY